ncbi:MAG: DUF4493 domain-containing protein [Muribaculaceae bacterium]|nr:DUF4493 domain-containing protein [Muribaculaceae bacterium]
MMKKLCSAAAVALLLGLTSCNEDNPWMGDAGTGAIKLTVSADGTVETAAPSTRATDLFEVPGASDFSVRLEKHDGSFSKEYELLEHFTAEPSFATGTYTLTAFYGRLEDEGFDKPHFSGAAVVNVLEARTTEVSVNAKLANSVVSINYTDNFKNYLSDYSTVIQSKGHTPVKFETQETRPAFIVPGEVDLTVTFSNPQGQSVTVQPASFTAEAGHHYNVKFDVDAAGQDMALSIVFDDELTRETVTIDLSDELFSTPGPSVVPVGFNADEVIEFLSGTSTGEKMRYNVISHGGLGKVNLTLSSARYTPPFGSEIELIAADGTKQQQLADLGFDIKGLFKNPDRMALVDFTNLPVHLAPGEYTLSLQAVDKFTRASEPVAVKLVCVAPSIEVTPMSAIFGLNQGSLEVYYTGSHPETDLAFQAKNKNGIYKDCEIIDVKDATRTRSVETNRYIVTISLPDTERDKIPVRVYLFGKLVTEENQVLLPVEMPSYSITADPFATKVLLKVNADDDQIPVLLENLSFDGIDSQGTLSTDVNTGIITISGLKPSTPYELTPRLLSSAGDPVSFTTEANTPVPNGNFSSVEEDVNLGLIDCGGPYTYLGVDYGNKINMKADRPAEGWATINAKTCYAEASPLNSWFCVPSTLVANGVATVRSVAYDHSGTLPATDAHGIFVLNKSSRNKPSSVKERAAGELFLGSYSYTGGVETRKDGIEFGSRPSSVTFTYSYSPINDEKGEAYIKVMNGTKVLASNSMDLTQGSNQTVTLQLSGYEFRTKATTLVLGFRSTKGVVAEIPIPSSVQDAPGSTPRSSSWGWGYEISMDSYLSKCVGSELKVSNVGLNY